MVSLKATPIVWVSMMDQHNVQPGCTSGIIWLPTGVATIMNSIPPNLVVQLMSSDEHTCSTILCVASRSQLTSKHK